MTLKSYSSLSEIQFATALALIKMTTPIANGIESSTIGRIFTGAGFLGSKHFVKYSPVCNKPKTMKQAATRRTKFKAPRSGASMANQRFSGSGGFNDGSCG